MRFTGFAPMLRHWAELSPESPALYFEENGLRSWSYARFYDEVIRAAEAYRVSGKTCLGVLCDGSRDCVTAIFAAVTAGLQTVLLDASLPERTLAGLLAYTDVDILWGERELRGALTPFLTDGVREGAGKLLFFTSGTTEQSKAVVLTEESLCASAWNGGEMLPLSREDTLLCMLPLGHVFGFVCGLLWGLSSGAAVALGRGARHYADDCAFFRPTALSAVPMLLGFLLKHSVLNGELKLILVGAGDCPPPLLAAATARGIRVSFGYGLTETSSGVAISVAGNPFAMEVCPDDTITLAPDGEILIEAPTCMMQGYYKRPADTEAVLSGGVLHTGDLGRWDEAGKLHITGRKKDMLVLGDGTKIFLPEYEGKLAAVLGTQELAVCLENGAPVLVLRGDRDRETELRAALAPLMGELPRGQQLRAIRFTEEPLPRTATGKLKRWEIKTGGETQ